MAEAIARYYNRATADPESSIAGVPLRDLTQAEYDELPKHKQAAVDAGKGLGLYRKTKPKGWVSQEVLDARAAKKAQGIEEPEPEEPDTSEDSEDEEDGEEPDTSEDTEADDLELEQDNTDSAEEG